MCCSQAIVRTPTNPHAYAPNEQECQAEADRAFLLTLAIPMALAVAAAAYVARPPPQELKDSGQIFEDDSTGSVFALPEKDTEPERDKDVSDTQAAYPNTADVPCLGGPKLTSQSQPLYCGAHTQQSSRSETPTHHVALPGLTSSSSPSSSTLPLSLPLHLSGPVGVPAHQLHPLACVNRL